MQQRIVGIVALLSFGSVACSDNHVLSAEDQAPEAVPATQDSAADTSATPDPDDTAAEGPGAAYYAIDVRFELVGGTADTLGQWQGETSSLSVDLWSTEDQVVCTHEVPIVAVTEYAQPGTGPEMLAWWRLDLDAGVSEGACQPWPARSWWLGFGPYDRRLDPMMAERGSLGFDVYGLYLQEEPGGTVYVIGMGGTNEMLLGQPYLTVDAAPLPDDAYFAQSLVLMSLD